MFKYDFALIGAVIILAVMGTVAYIVLTSIENARNEEIDVTNKSNLNNLSAQADLYHIKTNSYAGLCNSPEVIQTLTASGAIGTCNATETAWAAEFKLAATEGYYCIDSTGKAVEIPNTKGVDVTSC